MIRMKKIMLMFMLVMMISLVSAAFTSLGVYPQNQEIELIQLCDDCTYNNITSIVYPNGSIAASDLAMDQVGNQWNYTYTDTSTGGIYHVNGVGDEGGSDSVWAYTFEITETGDSLTTGEAIIYVFLLIFVSIIFAITLGLAINIKGGNSINWKGDVMMVNWFKYLKFVCIGVSYVMGIFILGIFIQISRNYLSLGGITKFFEWLYWLGMGSMYPIMIVLCVMMIVLFVADKKKHKELLRWGSSQ